MSCFLNTDAAPNIDLQSFDAKSRQVELAGSWITEKDSNGLKFRVSKTNGDTITLVFTGTQIYISGRINSKTGMQALFRIDEEGGGVLCATTAQPSSSVLLYGASSLLPGRHTLFIANQGHEVSLSGFQTINAAVSTTSISQTSTPSPTITTSLLTSPPSSANNSTSVVSSGTSLQTATSLPSTSLTLPTPRPSVIAPQSSSSDLSQGASRTPTLSTVSGPSYTVSIYTTVSILDGTTTTLVVESTVGTQHYLASHGPPQGTIPGAVAGGVVFLSFLFGVAIWWRNRRRHSPFPLMKDAKSSDAEPDMAMRLIPSATPSIYRPVSPATPPVLEITAGGTREHFHLDAEVEGPPSPSVPPSFHSDPEHYSHGLNDELRRSDSAEGPFPDTQDVTTSSTDPKTDSAPGDAPAIRSPPSTLSVPDEITAPAPAAAPRGERNVWRLRGREPRPVWVEDDGGVRLAGGPPLDARGEDGSGGWEVLPPPYARRFR